MIAGGDPLQLRRAALAVCVLHDVDLYPDADGLVLEGTPALHVDWLTLSVALAGHDPGSDAGIARLARWLVVRRAVADRPLDDLAERARPVGFPVEHLLHPGPGWAQVRVLGGALDLGLGVRGLDPARPEGVQLLPGGVAAHAGLPVQAWWPAAVEYLEDMGTMAVLRWRRHPDDAIRPMGDCDVVTLLGSRVLRHAVAAHHQGLAPVAVPMRTRGWLDLSRVDPAFVLAAASATPDLDRGFPRPLLVTGDEVVMVAPGGTPGDAVLREMAVRYPRPRGAHRDVPEEL